MSVETLMDAMKADNDFCSICLRNKAEVKLYPISKKIFQMFFIELVKCVDSLKASRSICVCCRQRVVNVLRLMETARTSNRILTNASLLKLQSQTSQQMVWDQIQTTKRMHGLTARVSSVMSCNIPPDVEIDSSVKPEYENSIFTEDVCLDNVFTVSRQTFSSSSKMKCNKAEFEQTQASEENHSLTSRTSRVISCNSPSDMAVSLSVKLEYEDGICDEDGNYSHASEIDMCISSSPKMKCNKAEFEQTQANEENHSPTLKTTQVISCISPPDAAVSLAEDEICDEDGNDSHDSEIDMCGLEHKDVLGLEMQNLQEINSQPTNSSIEVLKHIHLLNLTEAQRLQKLEERRQRAQNRNSSFKCKPCTVNITFNKTFESHMKRRSKRLLGRTGQPRPQSDESINTRPARPVTNRNNGRRRIATPKGKRNAARKCGAPIASLLHAPHKSGRQPSRSGLRTPIKRVRLHPDSNSGAGNVKKLSVRNDMERQRRIGLKNLFEELKREIPSIRNKERAPKAVVLLEAAALCRRFAAKERERNALRRRQVHLLARLEQLWLTLTAA